MMRAGLVVAIAVSAACPRAGWALERPLVSRAADLPGVDEVIAGSLRAVGGKEAVEKVKTLHAVFTINFGGQEIVNDTGWSRAGGRLARMSTPMGEVERGTDGKLAWQKTMMGYSLLEGEEAKQVDAQANLYMIVLEPDRLAKEESESIEVAGRESFDGKACYRVHYVAKDGKRGDVFFEVSSGMPVGMRQVAPSPRGEETSTILLKDWKEEKGVKFFRTMVIEARGALDVQAMTMTVTTLEVNTLADDAFAAPKEVERLAEAAKQGPAEGDLALSDLTPAQQTQAKEIIEGLKRMGSPAAVRSTMKSMEQASKHAPVEDRKMYEYIVQELKKHVAALEGGR